MAKCCPWHYAIFRVHIPNFNLSIWGDYRVFDYSRYLTQRYLQILLFFFCLFNSRFRSTSANRKSAIRSPTPWATKGTNSETSQQQSWSSFIWRLSPYMERHCYVQNYRNGEKSTCVWVNWANFAYYINSLIQGIKCNLW